MLWLEAGGISDFIEGRGNPHLTFSHPTEIVGRKSSHVSDRTLMVGADKAACDIRRDLVKMLTLPSTLVKVKISVEF